MRKLYVLTILLGCLVVATFGTTPAGAQSVTQDLRSDDLEIIADGKTNVLCKGGAFEHHGGDMAFWGDRAFILCGNDDGDESNDGFVIADISDPAAPREIGRFECTASATDIAVWGDLVFLAVDRNSESTTLHEGPYDADQDGTFECDDETLSYNLRDPAKDKDYIFRGVRIVSVADPGNPILLKNVQMKHATGTDAVGGIHTVTAVPEPGDDPSHVYVYASGLATGSAVKNFVLKVPLHDATGVSASTIELPDPLEGCHDMAFFAPKGLGICNGIGRGSVLWDVGADPLNPEVLGIIKTPNPSVRHHSSAFSWDGDTLVISDENQTTAPTWSCRDDGDATPPSAKAEGGLWFYDLSKVDLRSRAAVDALAPVGYQPPHPVIGNGWCTSTNFNVVPTLDADVLVAAWYGGGTTVVDFTDPAAPREIAHFIASPGDPRYQSFTRAAYWYNGHIYVNNVHGCILDPVCMGPTARGIDVLKLHDPLVKNHVKLESFDMGRQMPLPPITTTSLTYDGSRSAYVGSDVILAASLTGPSGPVTGASVTFDFNGQTLTAITDASGRAVISTRAALAPGTYQVIATFTGDTGLDPAEARADLVVTPRA